MRKILVVGRYLPYLRSRYLGIPVPIGYTTVLQ
jgi:hypothetical protein